MEDSNFLFAMQLVTASVFPSVLKAAIELDLLELIKKQGPDAFVSAAELAAQIPATNPEARGMLDRILSLLASYSVLKCRQKTLRDGGAEWLYSLTPVCGFLTKNEDGVSMAPSLLMTQDKVLMDIWYYLKDAVLEGGTLFNTVHKKSLYEYHAIDSTQYIKRANIGKLPRITAGERENDRRGTYSSGDPGRRDKF